MDFFRKGKLTSGLYLLSFFFISSTPLLWAQKTVCHFNQLKTENGLSSQTYNYHIFKDKSAYIWISSQVGLNRYDGRRVQKFRAHEAAPDSLLDDAINGPFFEDKAGRIWLSSEKAYYRFDPRFDQFTRHQIRDLPPHSDKDYQLKHIDTLNNIGWVRVDKTLYTFPLDRPENTDSIFKSEKLNSRWKVVWSKKKSKFFLFNHREDGLQIQSFSLQEEGKIQGAEAWFFFKGLEVNTSTYLNDSTIWVGLKNGLGRINLLKQAEFLETRKFHKKEIVDIKGIQVLDRDYIIVASRQSGLYLFHRPQKAYASQFYTLLDGRTAPFLKEIESIYLDRDRTLWISSQGNGVYFTHLDKVKFKSYFLQEYEENIKAAGVKMLTEDSCARLWGISEYSIFVWDSLGRPLPRLYNAVNRASPFKGQKLFYIYCDDEGRIWVGTQNGLFFYELKKRQFQQINIPADKPGVTAIKKLSNRRYLASTTQAGVFYLDWDAQEKKWISAPWIVEPSTFNWIYPCSDGRLLVNHFTNSIRIYPGSSSTLDSVIHLSFQADIAGFVEDTLRRKIWIPASTGLYYLASNGDTILSDDRFQQVAITGLLLDGDSNLWLSTPQGLICYKPERNHIRYYHKFEGLQGLEFNHAGFMKRSNGQLIFGGVNGFTVVDTAEINDISGQAYPVINKISVKGIARTDISDYHTGFTNSAHIRKIRLKYQYNEALNFSFAPREYSDPGNTKFHYLLIRGKKDTIDNASKNAARFIDLRQGDYELQVFAANSDGVFNREPHRLELTILPPWWATWWFYTLSVLSIAGVIYGYFRYRINILEERREKAETETAILRLQMNPHFLFNSMNSIAGYIVKKDVDKAYTYLSRFGSLMRKILYLAAKPVITLEEETALLEQYLKIEQMRFERRFLYSIAIDEQLDDEEVMVPTMLLQPFVENALKHGLANLQKEGEVQISFSQEGQYLVCMVQDNGIGRKAAAELKANEEHVSSALNITKRRLQLIEERTGKKTSLVFKDLSDDQQNACGTKVIISIPFL